MKSILPFIFSVVFIIGAFAQEKPTDYLSKEFHADRREALRKIIPENSAAVFFTNPIRNRANDVDYHFHQDPDFYYLTGYNEPNGVLIVTKSPILFEGEKTNEIIFVQERNKQAEMWTGKRLGVAGVKEQLAIKTVRKGEEFKMASVDFSSFSHVFFTNFKNDYRDLSGADVFDLVNQFKRKVNYEKLDAMQSEVKQIYTMIKATEIENSANVAQIVGYIKQYEMFSGDPLLKEYEQASNTILRKEAKNKIVFKLDQTKASNLDINSLNTYMGQLREIKLQEEMKLLKRAVEISAIGQIEIMKAMHPKMSELEIQGVHEFVYKKYGAEYEGYPSIVGAGHNGCILHYTENIKPVVNDELVLMDLGAEYHGYTADVTRTIPADGTFSKEQKAIYDIVYKAQEAGIQSCVVGAPFNSPNVACNAVINKGLVALGIIASEDSRHSYLPHGVTHYIGLDVHDKGSYGPFAENQVITVEPGIYIPEGSPCDKKWWGIAVRIEDDILITKKGPVNLSALAPRKSDEIEKMMQKKSVLEDFVLPELD